MPFNQRNVSRLQLAEMSLPHSSPATTKAVRVAAAGSQGSSCPARSSSSDAERLVHCLASSFSKFRHRKQQSRQKLLVASHFTGCRQFKNEIIRRMKSGKRNRWPDRKESSELISIYGQKKKEEGVVSTDWQKSIRLRSGLQLKAARLQRRTLYSSAGRS